MFSITRDELLPVQAHVLNRQSGKIRNCFIFRTMLEKERFCFADVVFKFYVKHGFKTDVNSNSEFKRFPVLLNELLYVHKG